MKQQNVDVILDVATIHVTINVIATIVTKTIVPNVRTNCNGSVLE
jgi:hypothetical protein